MKVLCPLIVHDQKTLAFTLGSQQRQGESTAIVNMLFLSCPLGDTPFQKVSGAFID